MTTLVAHPGGRHARQVAALWADQIGADALLDLGCPTGRGNDPWRLGEQLAGAAGEVDAVTLVASTRWGPRRVAPGPVVAGIPVALVQADHPGQLPPLPARPASGGVSGTQPVGAGRPWVVSAMAKDVFLAPAGRWVTALRDGGHEVLDLRADRARRDELLAALGAGPAVVLYGGHGRTRGWSGYQSLRVPHLAGLTEPMGTVVAFACDTLTRSRSRIPFATEIVSRGLARAYLGACHAIRTDDAELLSDVVVEVLAHGAPRTAAALVAGVEERLSRGSRAATGSARRPDPMRAWRCFRLLGDVTTPITQRASGSVRLRRTA